MNEFSPKPCSDDTLYSDKTVNIRRFFYTIFSAIINDKPVGCTGSKDSVDKLANVYYKKMRVDLGAPTLSARMVIGAVIIKHLLNIDDREVIDQITENVYLQYFVGLSSFQQKAPFDASLMVSIRKRLGIDVMSRLNEIILQEAGP